jgi:hypothetical protein
MIGFAAVLTVALTGATAGSAAARKVLELRRGFEPNYQTVSPGMAVEAYRTFTTAKFVGSHETLTCEGGDGNLYGHDETNLESKDKIVFTEVFGVFSGYKTMMFGCWPGSKSGEPPYSVKLTGLPFTLELSVAGKAVMKGAPTFTFSYGCAYHASKFAVLWAGAPTGGRLTFSARLTRTSTSPTTCEKRFAIEGFEGNLEAFGGSFWEPISLLVKSM